jgi:hypothetical protein
MARKMAVSMNSIKGVVTGLASLTFLLTKMQTVVIYIPHGKIFTMIISGKIVEMAKNQQASNKTRKEKMVCLVNLSRKGGFTET